MSISTKTGDNGTTSLWSGERVPKDSLRVESYGTIDELNSFLGDARHMVHTLRIQGLIETIQEDLFRVAGSLATSTPGAYLYPVTDEDVERLTSLVHQLEAEIPLKGFVIPGATPASARLDICRSICRRAERRIVALSHTEAVDGPTLRYVNRLSDLLFMMARYEEAQEGKIRYKEWPASRT
ncbi:MAG: cob(I)yrinic acid a,c-diamide adenosyltransferase [Treponemataceae bacterium]|nr:cob(I)yrinic acid a,c-diamide adenosyltransferase [Treponemataceae bacterium]